MLDKLPPEQIKAEISAIVPELLASFDHRFGTSSSGTARLAWERYRQTNYDVGGVRDESYGWRWDRDAWTVVLGHTWVLADNRLNDLRGQVGSRDLAFPVNSTELGEWFSAGASLQTGGHWLGPDSGLQGDFAEIRETFSWQPVGSRHQLKAGVSWLRLDQRYREDRFESGSLVYLTDDRSVPLQYYTGRGSSLVEHGTNLVAAFVHDDWRPTGRLTVGLGLRYDLDTNGNNPDLEHPVLSGERTVDTDNVQPRLNFAWDPSSAGRTVIRGGVGRFVGRVPNIAALYELQFNGLTARTLNRRISVPDLGIWIDPSDPENTGFGLAPDIFLLGDSAPSPESTQAGLGLSHRLGSTGLSLEVDAVWIEARHEIAWTDSNWRGNDDPCQDGPNPFFDCRIDPAYTTINRYTSDGRMRYRVITAAVVGTLSGGHLLSASLTVADKKNHADDLADVRGLPSDPADLEAEWGRSKTDERTRLVISGVFQLPWRLTLAPIYEYGSGQPWNRFLGYDANSDGEFTDRAPGVARNDRDGPSFSRLSLRLTKAIDLGAGDLDLIVEVFNLLNTTNYDVGSVIDTEYLAPGVRNPDFGTYTATLSPREIQLGLRYSF